MSRRAQIVLGVQVLGLLLAACLGNGGLTAGSLILSGAIVLLLFPGSAVAILLLLHVHWFDRFHGPHASLVTVAVACGINLVVLLGFSLRSKR